MILTEGQAIETIVTPQYWKDSLLSASAILINALAALSLCDRGSQMGESSSRRHKDTINHITL